MWMKSGLPTTLTTASYWVDRVDQSLEEVIPNLPSSLSSPTRSASPAIESSLDEAPAEVASAFGAMPTGLKLEVSALRDPMLASKLLSALLLPTDVKELLNVSQREMRRRAMDCLIEYVGAFSFSTYYMLIYY